MNPPVTRTELWLAGLLLAALAAACSGPASALPPEPKTVSELAAVESLEIQILESFPVQAHAVARGRLPDSCTSIDRVSQQLTGSVFDITLATLRWTGAACAATPQPFEHAIALEVAGLKPGRYTVTANGVAAEFELAVDNIPPATPAPDSGAISGRLWHDLCVSGAPGQPGPASAPEGCVDGDQGGYQANGVLEPGEPGIAGVQVILFSPPCDASSLPVDAVVTLTDYKGDYAFETLPAGEYCLRPATEALIPGGWTYPGSKSADGEMRILVLLEEGERKTGVDFGWDHQFLPMPEPVQSTPAPAAGLDEAAPAIAAAAREYIATQPGLAGQFDVAVETVEGDYARVSVVSTDPAGGFGGYLKREGGRWAVVLIGSGINPYDLYVLGVPFSLLPERARADELAALARVTVGYVAAQMNMRTDKVLVQSPVVSAGYARVSIVAPTGDGQAGSFSSYLKREAGNWVMLGIGSAFNPADLRQWGVPEKLWL